MVILVAPEAILAQAILAQEPFWLKAISSKTECENLVSPPLDGLIRWESVERRTRKM